MITERFAENNRLKRYAYDLIRKVFYKKVTHSFRRIAWNIIILLIKSQTYEI